VIGPDDNTAFVVLRGQQAVIRVSGLHEDPTVDPTRAKVGSEPTAIAITPNGKYLFVANWGEGTLTYFVTSRFTDSPTPFEINLSRALAERRGEGDHAPRVLGDAVLWPTNGNPVYQPALAHPRALSVTDDGDDDDDDESVYATEFFAQPRLGADGFGSDPDTSREGIVYGVPITTFEAEPLPGISPVETGFLDARAEQTSCFPNQLYAADWVHDRLFVTGMCASPRGPLGPGPKDEAGTASPANFKTLMHSALFVVDTRAGEEFSHRSLLFTRELERLYGEDETAGMIAERRMPLIPNDLIVESDGGGGFTAYVSAFGADALFEVRLGAEGSVDIGAPGQRYVALDHALANASTFGRLPTGVAASASRENRFLLATHDDTSNLLAIDLEARSVVAGHESRSHCENATCDSEQRGRRFFATGLDAWSYRGEAWSSCESCHPEGLSDGVTWDWPRGPRRSISTAGTYYRDQGVRRALLWNAHIDEVHDVEGVTRSVSGGVGGVVTHYRVKPPHPSCRLFFDGTVGTAANPPPECETPVFTTTRFSGLNDALARIEDTQACEGQDCSVGAWDDIDAFVRSVKAPRRPTNLDAGAVARGAELFEDLGCNGCHGGAGHTLSRIFYEPGVDDNGSIPFTKPSELSEVELSNWLSDAVNFGRLRLERYQVPSELTSLNPPAASGQAFFRNLSLDASGTALIDSIYDAGNDQLNCVLRDVGTFPPPLESGEADTEAVVPEGAPPVVETRLTLDNEMYVTRPALGATGFNIPSLVGLAVGAPYFHAGNARTLSELFDGAFSNHHRNPAVVARENLSEEQIRDLVSYLLSLDEYDDVSGPSAAFPAQPGVNVDFCSQFEE